MRMVPVASQKTAIIILSALASTWNFCGDAELMFPMSQIAFVFCFWNGGILPQHYMALHDMYLHCLENQKSFMLTNAVCPSTVIQLSP